LSACHTCEIKLFNSGSTLFLDAGYIHTNAKEPTGNNGTIPVIFSSLFSERQSARMSKITNDGITRSGLWCFMAVPIWHQ